MTAKVNLEKSKYIVYNVKSNNNSDIQMLSVEPIQNDVQLT